MSTNRPTVRRGRRRDGPSPLAVMEIRAGAPATTLLQDGGAQDSSTRGHADRRPRRARTDAPSAPPGAIADRACEPHGSISHTFGAVPPRVLDRHSAGATQSRLHPFDRGGGWPIATPLRMAGRTRGLIRRPSGSRSVGEGVRSARPVSRRGRARARAPVPPPGTVGGWRTATSAERHQSECHGPSRAGSSQSHSRLGRATATTASSVGPARRAWASGQLALP